METQLEAILQQGKSLYHFRSLLKMIGVTDETIAEAIRLGETKIPVFGQQLRGMYQRIGSDGKLILECHFAVPGWYEVLHVLGNSVTIKSVHPRADEFVCGKEQIRAILAVNLEYVEKGLNP
jgi:hypothetical protein